MPSPALMLTPLQTSRLDAPAFLIRLGVALTALGFAVSLAASPDPVAGLPWALQGWLGAALTWTAWRAGASRPVDGPKEPHKPAEETRAAFVARCFLTLGYTAAVALPAVTDWPTHKFPVLTDVYGALPSLLPHAPALAEGVSPNQTGGVLAAVAAFSATLLLASVSADGRSIHTTRVRYAAAGLAALATAGVLLSASRSAFAALSAAVLLTFTLRDRRGVWALAAAAGALLVAIVARPSLPGEVVSLLLHEEPLQAKLLARADIWASALRGVADHPFSGIGLGTLNDVLPVRYPYGSVGLSYTVTQAHNIVLDTALTMGLPAAFGLVLLSTGVVWTGVRARHERKRSSATIMGLTAIVVVFLTFGIADALSLSSPSSSILWIAISGIFYTGYLQGNSQA